MGFICERHGNISLELRNQSFYLYSSEPNETIELSYTDVQDLLDALMEPRVRKEWDNNMIVRFRDERQKEYQDKVKKLEQTWKEAQDLVLSVTERYNKQEISRDEWLVVLKAEEQALASYQEAIGE